MIEILPAILARDEAEFRAKLEKVRSLGLALHIDVMDGVFVHQKTWAPPARMRELLGDIPFEAHLMVADPEHAVPTWFAGGARHVIYHVESLHHGSMICLKVAERCPDLAHALNPDTPVAQITDELKSIDRVMAMGVTPGRSGQPFQESVINKVRELKRLKPALFVSVDGGVKPENARALADAGVDALIAGSALTDQADPAAALARFRAALAGS